MSTSNHYSFMILKMWYWNWNEDESISQVVLLNNDETLDDCVTDVVMKFALTHNISRPKHIVNNLSILPQMFLDDLLNLNLSEQKPCKYTNHTLMNVLSYTNTRGDGHIEVMGLYTNPYELLNEYSDEFIAEMKQACENMLDTKPPDSEFEKILNDNL